ncbi:hypothetical protein GK047_01125 [Paenibacillus sp. SYP-B3998]|uniref:Uncharacterized protein n=1 Tax=Paenibacillus sp. SYP-B3998 TaxID=2678564 RepID=A0A6G3ZQZ3_9BACL|nr:hypothetical protein [Paenibacillus sp. SYP-B3998]NEW04626.1 hypothetical protein [Paenibacillus sp. SYP-B3998]
MESGACLAEGNLKKSDGTMVKGPALHYDTVKEMLKYAAVSAMLVATLSCCWIYSRSGSFSITGILLLVELRLFNRESHEHQLSKIPITDMK